MKKIKPILKESYRPKRHDWQMPLKRVGATCSAVAENKSPLYAERLLIVPETAIPVAFLRNGEPWLDWQKRPLDAVFFEKWRTPRLIAEIPQRMSELDLDYCGVQLVIDNGDRIEVRFKKGVKATVNILGFIEE